MLTLWSMVQHIMPGRTAYWRTTNRILSISPHNLSLLLIVYGSFISLYWLSIEPFSGLLGQGLVALASLFEVFTASHVCCWSPFGCELLMVWPHEYERTRCSIELSGLVMNLILSNINITLLTLTSQWSLLATNLARSTHWHTCHISFRFHTKHSATLTSLNASQNP